MQESIRISTLEKEGRLQVSKSRMLPILIDSNEMTSLFSALEPFSIFDGSRPVSLEEGVVSKEMFLKHYDAYIEGIKEGFLIDEAPLRPFFSGMISCEAEALYAVGIASGKYLVKPSRPVIQMKRHHFIYSEGNFHPRVMGEESITWGIEFSFPNLSMNPQTKEIQKVNTGANFQLFSRLAKWVRQYTSPTPFLISGSRVNQPIRLGKACFEWINAHPSLKKRGLHVECKATPSTTR